MSEFEKVISDAIKEKTDEPKNQEDVQLDEIAEGTGGKKSYAERMKEKRQQCYAMIEDACLDVVKSPESLKQFLSVLSRFEKYSLNNNLLIYAQKPTAIRFKDFHSWVKDGVSVEGAKSFVILEPHKYTAADGSIRRGYNPKNVFDIADVDIPEIEYPEAKKYEQKKLLEALVHDSPVPICRAENNLSDSLSVYDPEQKAVLFKGGMSFDDIFPAIAKSLAHVEMATDEEQYRTKSHEFAARCTAYIIAQKYGVSTAAVDFHTIPERFEMMEAEDIKKELSDIHDSVKSLTERMTEVLDKEPNKDRVSYRTREVRA